jgi:hypothetical protein
VITVAAVARPASGLLDGDAVDLPLVELESLVDGEEPVEGRGRHPAQLAESR